MVISDRLYTVNIGFNVQVSLLFLTIFQLRAGILDGSVITYRSLGF